LVSPKKIGGKLMSADVEQMIACLSETLVALSKKRPERQVLHLIEMTNELFNTLHTESPDPSSWEGNFIYVANRIENMVTGMRRPISTVPGQSTGGQTGGASGGTGSSSSSVTVATIRCPNCRASMTISHP
jgi:hypothetical protein